MGKRGITGTFLDEISHDIPSANWNAEAWSRDFDAMKSIGIDTVIIIRAGFKDKAIFDSKSLSSFRDMRPAYEDLMDLYLCEAERCGMDLFFGIYDSGKYWIEGDYNTEVEINKKLTDEVVEKYGERKAFKGWYASHELHVHDESQMRIYLELSDHLKQLKDMPILMSPFVRGRKQFEDPITPTEHEKQWDLILSTLKDKVDIVAFQDGQVDFFELPIFMEINNRLATKYGMQSWSNVETFERGMPINFFPIDWRNLLFKMETAIEAKYEKLITFEFSHFLSPHSMYPSAHGLFEQYKGWLKS